MHGRKRLSPPLIISAYQNKCFQGNLQNIYMYIIQLESIVQFVNHSICIFEKSTFDHKYICKIMFLWKQTLNTITQIALIIIYLLLTKHYSFFKLTNSRRYAFNLAFKGEQFRSDFFNTICMYGTLCVHTRAGKIKMTWVGLFNVFPVCLDVQDCFMFKFKTFHISISTNVLVLKYMYTVV